MERLELIKNMTSFIYILFTIIVFLGICYNAKEEIVNRNRSRKAIIFWISTVVFAVILSFGLLKNINDPYFWVAGMCLVAMIPTFPERWKKWRK